MQLAESRRPGQEQNNISGYKNGGGGWGTIPHFICLCHVTGILFEKKLKLEDTHVYLTIFVLTWRLCARWLCPQLCMTDYRDPLGCHR